MGTEFRLLASSKMLLDCSKQAHFHFKMQLHQSDWGLAVDSTGDLIAPRDPLGRMDGKWKSVKENESGKGAVYLSYTARQILFMQMHLLL